MQQVNGVKTTLLGRKYYVKKTVTNGNIKLYQRRSNPVVKIAEKAAWSVFLTIWHCILNAELKKRTPSDYFFWRFCPLGTTDL